jgi:hypothetical protein
LSASLSVSSAPPGMSWTLAWYPGYDPTRKQTQINTVFNVSFKTKELDNYIIGSQIM